MIMVLVTTKITKITLVNVSQRIVWDILLERDRGGG